MARKIKVVHAGHLLKDYFGAKFPEINQKNFGKGRSSGAEWRRWLRDPRRISLSPVSREPVSRQTLRAQLRTKRYAEARIAGDRHRFPKDAQPSTRRERRALARAYAARDYAEKRGAQ